MKLYFSSEKTNYTVGDTFVVNVNLDRSSSCYNLVEATINYPKEFEVLNVFTDRSAINMWINQPKTSTLDHQVYFSGGIPNGYCGNNNLLAQIVFQVKSPVENAYLDFNANKTKVFLNDGKGTVANISLEPMMYSAKESATAKTMDKFGNEVLPTVSASEQAVASENSKELYQNYWLPLGVLILASLLIGVFIKYYVKQNPKN